RDETLSIARTAFERQSTHLHAISRTNSVSSAQPAGPRTICASATAVAGTPREIATTHASSTRGSSGPFDVGTGANGRPHPRSETKASLEATGTRSARTFG